MRRKITSKISSFLLLQKSPGALPSIHRQYHNLAAGKPIVPQLQGLRNCYSKKVKKCEISANLTSLPTSSIGPRYLSSNSSQIIKTQNHDDTDEIEPIEGWEEEEEELGDGGDGGGVVLRNCPWGEKALSIAHEVLLQFDDDMNLFAFKTSPRGYIYVRLDKLSNEFGCPSMEVLEYFSREYKAKLDEVGSNGEIPDDLALDVSSPGAERLLKVPDDLNRFKEMIMCVTYIENSEPPCPEKSGVFLLDTIEPESGFCIWKLADVKENRDPVAKGRPMSRKQKDWRLRLPYAMHKRINLFLDY